MDERHNSEGRKKTAASTLFELAVIASAFILLSLVIGSYRAPDFIIFCIYVLGFNLLYGFMGRLSFGHMLYLGTGAYAVTLFAEHSSHNPFLALSAAIMAGALIGIVLGPIIVRATGACFALINLAFNQIGHFLVLVAFSRYTGGEDGMSATFSKVGLLNFGSKPVMFGFSLFCLLITYYFLK
ncbi:MAG TPA: branched-chain amino acid ABC transporter permease, partial [Thermodesulfovibrionales bacterium]|nr:branched-chain amino acid ABC transporter permease [Thermodesulfovibrionales bacterium]